MTPLVAMLRSMRPGDQFIRPGLGQFVRTKTGWMNIDTGKALSTEALAAEVAR